VKIGIVCYPSFGGSGVVAAELARGFAERGHRVHVVASAPPSRTLPLSDHLHFHAVRIPDYPVFEHRPYEHALAATLVDVASAERLDVLHAHYAVPHATSALLARQVLGAAAPRLVVTLHGTDVTRTETPGARALTRFAVAAADHVTVPSVYLRSAAQRTLGLDDALAIEVIPNFVDTERFAPPPRRERARLAALFDAGPDGPILFHVSNFRPIKRTVDLIDVLAEVRRHLPARLVVVGDGPERGATAAHARACGLTDSVRFLGQRHDFAEDLGCADAFILPSESESFGVAALEALSAGVPVFGYRVGGLPEVVVDGTGVLVAPFDTAALARAVLDAVTDPERRTALGRAARAHVLARFGRTATLDRFEACFRRVLA
jgi:N-acetyl-alpha-D-glucosaminyl L-malate synthase BshA